MQADTKRQLSRLLFWVCVGAVFGATIGGGVGPFVLDPPLVGAGLVALMTSIDTATVAALIAGGEIFLPKTRLGRTLDNAPFLATITVKVLAYSLVIVGVIGGRLGDHFVNASGLVGFIAQTVRLQVKMKASPELMVATSIMPVLLFLMLLQLIRLVGDRTFRDIILGRYHRPRLEERFFLFVDIVGSTPLAERLGPAAVHDFLNRVFCTASNPIDDHLGEVYQYVGDEIVITWTVPEGRASALPLACFFAIQRALERVAHDFEREFGAVPRLRAALHAGPVIAGEVGGSRRSIVFHGDVMNTASRLENATRDLERPFLVSEDALKRLEGFEGYTLVDLGLQQLRGRTAPLRVYAAALGTTTVATRTTDLMKVRLSWRVWISLASAMLISVVAAGLLYLDRPLRAATGFISHTLCSGAFVSGLSPDQVYAQTLKPMPGVRDLDWAIRYEIAGDQHEVRASLAGAFERRAVFAEGLGCMLAGSNDLESSPSPEPLQEAHSSPVLPEIAGTAVVEPADERLRAALDRSFAESDKPPHRQTAAVVVVHDGRIVAERYAAGYGVDTPILGWSVTKSVTSALVGILVRQGRLSVDGPAPVHHWRDPADQRHAISIDMLLRMTSGLDLLETNRGYDAVSRMLLIESDMADFAERASLASPPGTTWEYTSGNTLILSRIIRDAVGGHVSDVLEFARGELFGPLGMRKVTLEFDAAGTPVGSTYLYASARDWARFGMLYLEDGVVGGRRILPNGWVRYSSSQTLDSPYAAGFWRGSSGFRKRWGIPEDAFFASGLLGQRVMVIPSERLVVARFGNAHGPGYDLQGFGRLVADVRETLSMPR